MSLSSILSLIIVFVVVVTCFAKESKNTNNDNGLANLLKRFPSTKIVSQTLNTYLTGNSGIGLARPIRTVVSTLPSQYMVQKLYINGNATNPCAAPVVQAMSIGINTCLVSFDYDTNNMEYIYVSYSSSMVSISTYNASTCTGPTNSAYQFPVGSCYGNMIKVSAPQSTINYGSTAGFTVT